MNLYGMVKNNPVSRFDILGLQDNTTVETGFGTVSIGSLFSANQIALAEKAICVIKKLLGGADVKTPPWNLTYNASAPRLQGLTRKVDGTRIIMIFTQTPSSETEFMSLLNWGATLVHEADHYFNDSIFRSVDGEEERVQAKIDRPLADAITKAILDKRDPNVCQGCKGKEGFWEVRNKLEEHLCACGIDLSPIRKSAQ